MLKPGPGTRTVSPVPPATRWAMVVSVPTSITRIGSGTSGCTGGPYAGPNWAGEGRSARYTTIRCHQSDRLPGRIHWSTLESAGAA